VGLASANPDSPVTTRLVPGAGSSGAPAIAATPPGPAPAPADDALHGDDGKNLQHQDAEVASAQDQNRAGDPPRGRQKPARSRREKAHVSSATSDDADGHDLMAMLPIHGMVNEIVGGVVPRAVEFSNSVMQLALNEQQLELRLEQAEEAAAEPGASAKERDEVVRLKKALSALKQRRERLEHDFEASMDAWGKDFEQRFEREHAPRFAAWGENFGRRMEAMGKDLERRLSTLRALPIPAPAPLPNLPRSTPMQPNVPAPVTPPAANPPPALPPAAARP
jgi:hypothetical protein